MTASQQIIAVSGFNHTVSAHIAKLARTFGCKCVDLDHDAAAILTIARKVAAVLLSPKSKISLPDLRRIFPAAKMLLLGSASTVTAGENFDAIIAGSSPDRNIIEQIRPLLAEHEMQEPLLKCGEKLVGQSDAMTHIRRLVRRLSSSRATALIHGATGTGKEIVALLLHHNSPCADAQLIPINCAAIPEAMIEGELFGYEKGAFSGAIKSYPGKFRLAHGGTLFLDEVGELSLAAQAKILRALETGEVFPLGSLKPVSCSVRVIAATNRDLRKEVKAGRFRADLFYRLAVVQLPIPPLHERREDVVPIATHLLTQICAGMECAVPHMEKAFMAALETNAWLGNVREMRNAIEHAVATAADLDRLTIHDLPEEIVAVHSRDVDADEDSRDESERDLLLRMLRESGGQKTKAARRLNCSRMTLYRRLERAGISVQQTHAQMA
ncbi:MAG: sigma-54 dependent transcriptional regulator [Sphingorhabdus sp.]